MRFLKWLFEQIANNFVTWILATGGGIAVVIFAPVRDYAEIVVDLFLTPIDMSAGFVGLSIISTTVALAKSVLDRLRSGEEPAWKSFKRTILHGIVWRWDYDADGEVIDVQPHCPNCDCLLEVEHIRTFEGVDYICHMCGLKHFWPYRCANHNHTWMIAKKIIEASKRRMIEQG